MRLAELNERYRSDSAFRDLRRRASWRRNLLVSFGLSEGDYWMLDEAQGGMCATCGDLPGDRGRIEKDGWRVLAVDYDHVAGRVRGLLCDRCRLTLVRGGYDPELLRVLAAYIENEGAPASRRRELLARYGVLRRGGRSRRAALRIAVGVMRANRRLSR